MFRALSTRRSSSSYERLTDESAVSSFEWKLKRVTSLPARVFGSSSKKLSPESTSTLDSQAKSTKKKVNKKSHPIFSLSDSSSSGKKKVTSKPEFARYMEYLKEGGMWDVNTDMPVIYFK
ncbi:hypothetical protein HS088_TW14G00151 [Tripterygium wilfordii]|uniref:Uncharacterized protein n=1 Tax=Tripterygium wilfordii TaxID=458696 RepID=A0A7J7CPX1_TRIWF|nr:uncharacterized protein LOC120014833 [Tripterygium wilfordii]KAF5736019.1 hypothetical protein HS088_TW14G00151 [Tripterygium wilfordii]